MVKISEDKKMNGLNENKNKFLFRLIVPAHPRINIYTLGAKLTTALGPVMVATAANKLWHWQVEIIDENNYYGPKNSQGLPDHSILQKERPADVVGFYCGLTSTIERVWQLAKYYQSQKVITIAGGWHAFDCLEETLNHNIDIVVHGEGERYIPTLLEALRRKGFWEVAKKDIPGISFLENGKIASNSQELIEPPGESKFLNSLPLPDFGLLKYAKLKVYPISRIRGCQMDCEFCRVKGTVRWSSPERLLETVDWLVSSRKAQRFFIVDDRLEGDLRGTKKFFKMVAEKYRNKLWFIVQVRLEAARDKEFLEIMKKAGVAIVCIGYESPIKQDLKSMNKGYSVSRMLHYTKIWRQYFRIHGMFIVGYPLLDNQKLSVSAKKIVKTFKRFIRKAKLYSIQVLLPGPAPGTKLRKRLEEEKRIFSLTVAPWNLYDGQFVLFRPDNITPEELQKIPLTIMKWFYSFSFVRLGLRIFSLHRLFKGKRSYLESLAKEKIKYLATRLIEKWQKAREAEKLIKKIREQKDLTA